MISKFDLKGNHDKIIRVDLIWLNSTLVKFHLIGLCWFLNLNWIREIENNRYSCGFNWNPTSIPTHDMKYLIL